MKKYRISEIARLFNITRETLIYYDQIGILKPAYVDKINGYRYYDDETIIKLNFILTLKEANFSLNEIKRYLEARNRRESLNLLEEKLVKIEEQINILNNSKEIIKKEIHEINETYSLENRLPFLEEQEQINVFVLNVPEPKGEYELQEGLVKLKKIKDEKCLKKIKRITILKKEDILEDEFFRIDKVGYILPTDLKECLYLQGGKFACIYHKDETKTIGESYQKLLNYIQENNSQVIGDSREYFEELIVNSGDKKGRIIKICIPVK